MPSEYRPIAVWMLTRIRAVGAIRRIQLISELTDRYPTVDVSDKALWKAFRVLHAGTVRWEAEHQRFVALNTVTPVSRRLAPRSLTPAAAEDLLADVDPGAESAPLEGAEDWLSTED